MEEWKEIMNPDVDPCDDFSEYVCGNYGKKYKIPSGDESISYIYMLINKVQEQLKSFLEEKHISTKIHAIPIQFYDSCMDDEGRDKNSRLPIQKMIKKINTIYRIEQKFGELIKSGLGFKLFAVFERSDSNNPGYNSVYIGLPTTLHGDSYFQNPDEPGNKQKIQTLKLTMKKLIPLCGEHPNKVALIDEVIQLNIKIGKILPSVAERRNISNFNTRMSIGELKRKCHAFDWISALNTIYSDIRRRDFTDNDQVTVQSISYVENLCGIIDEYKSDKRKYYAMSLDFVWAIIERLARSGSSQMVKAMSYIYYIPTGNNKWEKCFEETKEFLHDIMAHLYVKKYFKPSMKTDTMEMVKSLKASLEEEMTQLDWMDQETKDKAIDKLRSMKLKIGYPDSILNETKLSEDFKTINPKKNSFVQSIIDLSRLEMKKNLQLHGQRINDDFWVASPIVVNAHYNPIQNEIIFPAAILQEPFYNPNLPRIMRFGGLGAIVGHEMIHGFDNSGALFDKHGRLKNWWDAESKKMYTKKTECLINQYGQYTMNGVNLPSLQTIGEDIADNGAVRMAFKAAFNDRGVYDKRLEGLEFTPPQLFFIRYASIYCSNDDKEVYSKIMKVDNHSIQKFRIIGPLSNMPEFSAAFHCSRTSKMNRGKKRCVIW